MTIRSQYVGRGLVRVAAEPALFRAIVGPGYAVCVSLRGGEAGGMAHVAVEGFSANHDGGAAGVLIANLLVAIKECGGSLRGARAEIIGGADILELYPQQQRPQIIAAQVEIITSALTSQRVGVRRARSGGTAARRVEMLLPGGMVDTQSVKRSERKRPGLARLAAAMEVERTPLATPQESEIIVNMGCLAVAKGPATLSAILGSCVGIAVFDPTTNTGGLAHVMMPENDRSNGNPAKYADTAVPALLHEMSKAGVERSSLVAKLTGGACVLGNEGGSGMLNIGERNLAISRQALTAAGIDIVAEDTGGVIGRKMSVDLTDFAIVVRLLQQVGAG